MLCMLVLSAVASSRADTWDAGDDTSSGATQLEAPTKDIQYHGVHTLDPSDTADWFKVQLTAGTSYVFESTGPSDTEGFLYSNPAGTPVAQNSDDGEDAFNFLVTYTPSSSGTYYLKVEEWFGGNASYTLGYRIGQDNWDPIDDAGGTTAQRTLGDVKGVEVDHVLSEMDAADWYRFSLTAGNTYRFQSTGSWDLYASLFSNAGGTSLITSDDNSGSGNNFQLDYSPASSGDYYLRVVQTNNPVPYARYSLEYFLIEDQWDSGDDSGSGATTLGVIDETVRYHGPHSLNMTGDTADWFKINLDAGQTYRFESTGDSDTKATLYEDQAGNSQVAYNDDFQPAVDSNFGFSYTPTSGGNYFLKVNISVGDTAIYSLKYRKEGSADADGDGMPDAWEIQYFGSTNELSSGNWDHDSFLNGEEYIAGTDPTDPASFFAITNWSTGSFIIEWPAFSNRQYQVYRADSMTNTFLPVGGLIYYPQNSYTDSASQASGFFRVEVQLQ